MNDQLALEIIRNTVAIVQVLLDREIMDKDDWEKAKRAADIALEDAFCKRAENDGKTL